MSDQAVKLSTTLTTEQRRMLDELCKDDRRTISATLGLLIEREWQRRHSQDSVSAFIHIDSETDSTGHPSNGAGA